MMKLKNILLLTFVFTSSAYADTPFNASCVIEKYNDYSDTFISMTEQVKNELKNNHPAEYKLYKPCLDLEILDEQYKREIVDKLWKENPDKLFKRPGYLRDLGAYPNAKKVFKKEHGMCKSSFGSVDKKRREKIILLGVDVERKNKAFHDKYINYLRLRVSDIKCSDK
jgi:hypothetical protein